MARTGFYPGSFDPVTNGHLDIITRAAKLVDKLVIGVGVHHGKAPLFSTEERLAMLDQVLADVRASGDGEIAVTTFDNLTVDAARDSGADVIFRGLRDAADFDYEMQMAGMNGCMAPDVQTVFLAASPDVRHIAASLVRQIAHMGGTVSAFVPETVEERLAKKFSA